MSRKYPKAFFSLDDIGKVMFANGLPIDQCHAGNLPNPIFANLKLDGAVVSSVIMQKAFDDMKKRVSDTPFVTIFHSKGTDEPALDAVATIIRAAGQHGDFMCVNKQDWPPYGEDEKIFGLYVLMGVHHDDPDICSWVRTWIRSRIRVPIWITLTSPDPIAWYREKLGIKPHFLFSLRASGQQSG